MGLATMTPRAVRIIVIAVCVGGVAGMILTTIRHHSGAALTFGIITAVAVLCLMVATAVAAEGRTVGGASPDLSAIPSASGDAEAGAARVEENVAVLVAAGADESKLRDLVRDAVRLGRSMGPTSNPP